MLLIAASDGRTLSDAEDNQFHEHVAGCETCRALAIESAPERMRWVARVPEDALDDPDLLVLPTVDPIVFDKGAEIAHGGMGRITRARDRRLGREVAIKEVLAPHLRARFEREAMITARLQHPAIVPIYEAGTWPDGSAFYTMRLVPGRTLADAIAAASTLEDRLALLPHVVAVTEALAYAHAQRIVHRDLKPANVLVGAFGETVVIDWGLAKELGRAGPVAGDKDDDDDERGGGSLLQTRAGSVVGTPGFLAPEQAAGAAIDERADVYALGALLYNLLAGHPPYWDTTEHDVDELIQAAVARPPTPIARIAPRTPEDLRAIVERAMAHDPAARYASGREMAEELRRFEAGQLLGSRQYGAGELIARWVKRHRAAVAVGAVAAAVLAVGGAVSVQQIVVRERATAHALAESQLEQGRQLFVAGDPGQAAPYLAAALAALPDDRVARRLAAMAVRDVARRLGGFTGTAAAFRPDGAELAIGQADGSIAVIDPATGRPLRTLAAQGGAIADLAYSGDGTRLAIASTAGACVRDARTGARLATATEAPASAVQVLPPGDRFAIATRTSLRMVGLDGTPRASDDDVPGPRALELSRDGAYLAAVAERGAMAWRTSDLARVAHVGLDGVMRFSATFAHGDVFTAGFDGLVRWGTDRVTTLVPEQVVALSWLDDHTLFADRMTVDTATGAVHSIEPHSVQASAAIDASHAIAGGYDRALRIWDVARPAHPIAVLDTEAAISRLAVDPTGHRAFSRGREPGDRVELWDVTHLPAPIRTTMISAPDAKLHALLADHRDRLVIHIAEHGVETTRLLTAGLDAIATLDGWPLGFRPGSDELATDIDGRVAARVQRDIAEREPIWHAAFSASGAAIATSSDHGVALRDAGWRTVASFEVGPVISALAVDDAGRIVTGHKDGTLRIWDARRGALLATATGHTVEVEQIAILGDTLITGSWDLTARRWAYPSGEPRGVFSTSDRGFAVSPGGDLIVAASGAGTVKLWDAARGRLLADLPASMQLAGAAFTDGDHVVVAGSGRLELLDVAAPVLAVDEVMRRAAATRWQLVGGRAIDRTPAPPPP